MDDQRFDRLTKAVAGRMSRRNLLRLLGASVVGAATGLMGRSRGAVLAQLACDLQCNIEFQGLCVPILTTLGEPCDDGDPCTTGETCQLAGSRNICGGVPVTCPAPDPCHLPGTCDPGGGCSPPTVSVATCQSGRIKDGPCLCDGACCAQGNHCVGKPGERRCKET